MPALASRFGSPPSSAIALVGAGDPASSRLVYSMVIGLVVIGLLLIALAIWIIRQTRVDLDVLAPLERMGDGEWKKRDRSTQRRMLDEVRPDGAQPLAPAKQPPSLDDDFELAEHPVTSFSDLAPGVTLEERDPTPVGSDADEPAIGPILLPVIEVDDEVIVEPEAEPDADESGTEPDGDESDAELEAESDTELEAESDADDPGAEPEAESAPESRT